jgi:hypothetical protein
MLSQLVGVVFRNNQPLCQQFWESWESYLSRSSTARRHEFPICRLLDAAYNLSREHLAAVLRGHVPREEFLEATAPFFKLLSVLCHTPTILESMVDMLPPAMIRTALQCCASTTQSDASAPQHRASILESFEGWTKVASSSIRRVAGNS